MSTEQNASRAQAPCISLLAEIDRIIEEHPTSGDHAEDGRYCLHDRTAALYALAAKYDLIPKANSTYTMER
jgi:hypothetical protein